MNGFNISPALSFLTVHKIKCLEPVLLMWKEIFEINVFFLCLLTIKYMYLQKMCMEKQKEIMGGHALVIDASIACDDWQLSGLAGVLECERVHIQWRKRNVQISKAFFAHSSLNENILVDHYHPKGLLVYWVLCCLALTLKTTLSSLAYLAEWKLSQKGIGAQLK